MHLRISGYQGVERSVHWGLHKVLSILCEINHIIQLHVLLRRSTHSRREIFMYLRTVDANIGVQVSVQGAGTRAVAGVWGGCMRRAGAAPCRPHRRARQGRAPQPRWQRLASGAAWGREGKARTAGGGEGSAARSGPRGRVGGGRAGAAPGSAAEVALQPLEWPRRWRGKEQEKGAVGSSRHPWCGLKGLSAAVSEETAALPAPFEKVFMRLPSEGRSWAGPLSLMCSRAKTSTSCTQQLGNKIKGSCTCI